MNTLNAQSTVRNVNISQSMCSKHTPLGCAPECFHRRDTSTFIHMNADRCTPIYRDICTVQKCTRAYNCAHTPLQPREQMPQKTLHISQFLSNTPQIFPFKQKEAGGEREHLVVKPSYKCLSGAFLMGSKDP